MVKFKLEAVSVVIGVICNRRSVIYGDGQKNFRPDDIITLPEAVVILIRLMRIEYEATSNGGYPGGYIRTATKYDIISPSMSNKGNLTYQDAAMLIYNTLNTRVEHLGSIGTLLSMYHGVYYGEGRINAVYGASVNEEKVPEIGQVSIGGKTFLCGNSWFYDRLGIYVRYYYRKTEGLEQIVYISEDNNIKNDVIEITSDNYEGFADGYVEYYQSEASSGTKKARIYDGVTVIRNGQNVSGDLKYAFSDFYGTMKLIKTGKNESADVVIIEDYENIEAGHINSKEKVIYDKNNSSFSVNLSDKDGEFIYYVDTEGNASSFDKIGAEDIISVAQSKDRSFTKVIISANSVTGVIEGTKASKNSLIIKLDSSGNSVTYAVLSADYVSTDGKYKNPDLTLIGEGDVIRIATNYKNEIASIELILDYSQAKADGDAHFFDNALNPSYKAKNGVAVGNFFDGFKMSYGYASRTSGNLVQWGYDKPGDANEIYNVTFDSNKAKIIVYDEDDKEDPCKLGSIKDIVGYYSSSGDYSKLICVSRSAIITNMVVYK